MQPNYTFQAHDSYVLGVRFTRDGRYVFSAGMDNVVKLWSAEDWSLQRTFSGHDKSVNCFALAADDTTLVTGSSDTTVRTWDVATGAQRLALQDRKRVVAGLSVSADGEWVAAGSYKGRIAIWTIKGESVAAFQASKQHIGSVAFSPADRTHLAAAGLGPDITVWSLPESRPIETLAVPTVAVRQVRYTPDGRHLMALTYEGAMHVWSTRDWAAVDTPAPAVPGARQFALDRTGNLCVILSDGNVQIRSFPGWKRLLEFPVDAKVLNGATFSPSGQMLVVGAADRKIRVWDVAQISLP